MFRVSLGRIKILTMNLNPEKCKELRISFACNSKKFHAVVVEGKELQVVSSTKLLGLTLSDTDNGIDDLVEKATIERGHTF